MTQGHHMKGREEKQENDLFFVCSIIEYISRKTKNKRSDVVRLLGEQELSRLFQLADVLHSEALENTANDVISKCNITNGNFDNVALCKYAVPSHFDIAKVYKRLIVAVSHAKKISFVDTLIMIYTSWISDKIDDYNSSMYFENPQYLYESYNAGFPL
jgi:hypothetical protein